MILPAHRLLAAGRTGLEVASFSIGPESGSNTITVDKPDGTEAGDLLVALMHQNGATNRTWSGDSGWAERADPGTVPSIRIATKIAGASEPGSYTFTTNINCSKRAVILRIPGAAWDTIGAITTYTGSANITAASIVAAGGLLFQAAVNNSSRDYVSLSGMDLFLSAYDGGTYLFANEVGEGATGGKTLSTAGVTVASQTVLFSVKEA
ncbi:hypothetical protein MB02_01175 [Croceicoccus estronivorus]|uniref:hypothetical protein n=1 Tax=Croceicoccus estronivorus TaxID=1172626 RepID=UPI00082E6020|nr:hypothetical protein [Croceicoccus estronivorus]OCC25314.1 hypothetical protein MB02_01175 [Croceicoccus estronivorus]